MIKTATKKTTGDLGHNASVAFIDDPYIDIKDNSTFYLESVSISNKTTHVVITALEALNLLRWLRQEEGKLRDLVKAQESEKTIAALPLD